MPTSLPSISSASPAQPRKRARTLPHMALALATLATAGLFNAAHATFPGENGVIVFDSLSTTGSEVIKRVSPSNSAVINLGTGRYPSVSPNGKKVAFLKGTDVYVMNIDGSNVVQLTTLPTGQTPYSPAWLPDGSKVMYGLFVAWDKPIELWTVKPDGTGRTFVRQLNIDKTTTGGLDLALAPWISLSTNIYTFNGGGLNIANDATPTITNLATDGGGSSWAPDARSILFHNNNGQQFEINPDGSNRRSVPSAGGIYETGAISPDGKYVAGGVMTNLQPLLTTRPRAGTPTTFSWPDYVSYKTDWSRAPKNCYTTTLEGGGEVLAGDVDFYAGQCAIVVMPDGGLNGVLEQAIAIGPDSHLYHRALKPGPSGGAPVWTPFLRVPGAGGSPNGILAKKIAIAASKDGSAQVVIMGAGYSDNNVVYHAMRYANGTWSGFTALNGVGVASNFAARDVAITIGGSTPTSPGNAQVIANGLVRGDLYHRVRWVDGSWTPFASITPNGVATHEIALAAAEDGNTNVLAMTTLSDGSQGRIMQALRYASGNWTGWVTVGMPNGTTLSASSDVAVTRTLSGAAQLMYTDSAGNVLFQERSSPNISETWQTQVPNVLIADTIGRGVSISAGATPNSSSELLLTRTFPQ